MIYIFKSYLKSYFKNLIEAIGLILFIIVVIATIFGILSGVVQYMSNFSDMSAVSKNWDYSLQINYKSDTNNFKPWFVNDYYTDKTVADHQIKVLPENAFIDTNSEVYAKWVADAQVLAGSYDNAYSDSITESIIGDLNLFKHDRPKPGDMVKYGLTPWGYDQLTANNYDYRVELLKRLLNDDKKLYNINYQSSMLLTETGDNFTNNIQDLKNFFIEATNTQDIFNRVGMSNQLKTYGSSYQPGDLVMNAGSARTFHYAKGQLLKWDESKDGFESPILKQPISELGLTRDTVIRKYTTTLNGVEQSIVPTQPMNNFIMLYTSQDNINQLANDYANNSQSNKFVYTDISEFYINLTGGSYNQLNRLLSQAFVSDSALNAYAISPVESQNQSMNIALILMLIIGIVLLVIGFIFINFTMRKEMIKTRRQLGIFKSYGYKTSELSWVFTTKFFITTILGIVIGFAIGVPLQIFVAKMFTQNIMIPFDQIYTGLAFMLVIFLGVPFIFCTISYLLTINFLNKPVTDLLFSAPKEGLGKFSHFWQWAFQRATFLARVQVAFTFRSFGKYITVMVVFLLSTLLFLFTFNTTDLMKSMASNMNVTNNNSVDHTFMAADKVMSSYFYDGLDAQGQNFQGLKFKYDPGHTEYIAAPKYGPTYNHLRDVAKDFHNKYGADVDSIFNDHKWDTAAVDETVFKLIDSKFPVTSHPEENKKYKDMYNQIKKQKQMYALMCWAINFMMPTSPDNHEALRILGTVQNMLNDTPIANPQNLAVDDVANITDISSLASVLTGLQYLSSFIHQFGDVPILGNLGDMFDKTVRFKAVAPTWLQSALMFAINLKDPSSTYISLNKMYYDSREEAPYLHTVFYPNIKTDNSPYIKKMDFYGIQKQTLLNGDSGPVVSTWKDYWKFDGVNDKTVNEIFSPWDYNSHKPMPVIVSSKIAYTLDWHAGETHLVKPLTKSNFTIPIKVCAVVNDDTLSKNIYTSDENLKQLYLDASGQRLNQNANFYNAVVSRSVLVNEKININEMMAGKQMPKYNIHYIGVAFQNPYTSAPVVNGVNDNLRSYKWWELMGFDKLKSDSGVTPVFAHSSYDPNNLTQLLVNPQNVMPIGVIREALDQGMQEINDSFTILQALIGITVFLILTIIVSSIIDESSDIILMFRAVGYKNWQVNFIVIGNYVVGIIITAVIAYLLSIAAWAIVTTMIFHSYGMIMNIPINWATPLKTFGIIIAILVVAWLAAMALIRTHNLNEVTN